MNGWYFKPRTKGDTIREPIHGEFFATDAISDPGTALVREGIQNSLDAARSGEKVSVRIYLSGENEKLPAERVDPYFHEAWDHLLADENGLSRDEVPERLSTCPFLVFEDFGTTGLEGDPAEAFRNRSGGKNHFYHFFRAEGQSDKDSSDRGSWGVGKQVFPRSSRISGMFGVTVRASDNEHLMMGRLILKSHYVDEDCCQDGYFGTVPEEGNHLVMPIAALTEIDKFCNLFDLQRGTDPGLSLIVPWPDPEITEDSLVRSVLRDYFYPILSGALDVYVETPSIKTVLDSNSLIDEARKLGDQIPHDFPMLLELADWARQVPTDQKIEINMPDPERAWKWSDELIPLEKRESLRQAFQDGGFIAVRIPVTVRKNNTVPALSYFDVFLVRDDAERGGRPTFIREGVIIPKIDSRRSRGVRALVIIDNLSLAAFLRDAENPSHTEWQHDGSNFRGKYKSGRSDLDFVKRSVHEIVRSLTEAEREVDKTLLIDLFSLPSPLDEAGLVKTKNKKTGKKSISPPPPPPPPKQSRFRVRKMLGGFSIVPGDPGSTPPELLDIRVAYDVRRGNAIKRYNRADFQLDKKPIRFDPEPQGIEILENSENRVLLKIKDPSFSLHATGFDERRDLYVRAVPKESIDGRQTP